MICIQAVVNNKIIWLSLMQVASDTSDGDGYMKELCCSLKISGCYSMYYQDVLQAAKYICIIFYSM